MKRFILSLALVLLGLPASGQEPAHSESVNYATVSAAVSRFLSIPGYTEADETMLKQAGDLAAVAVMKSVPPQDLRSQEKSDRVLFLLRLAFAAPRQIQDSDNRVPAVAMYLLDELQHARGDAGPDNNLQNTRIEIETTARTGKPVEIFSIGSGQEIDNEHTQWIENVLQWTLRIRPGMTRKELLKVFTEEGGISSRDQRRYVLRRCPYIKVDVEFSISPRDSDQLTEKPGDKIRRISKPYLEFSILD